MSNITRVAIAIVRRADQVLVGIRPEGVPLAGMHEFPGGKCEDGESPEEALVREVQEETGLTIIPQEHLRTVCHSYDHGEVELHFWICGLSEEPASPVRLPFEWRAVVDLPMLNFPEANQDIIWMLVESDSQKTGIIIVDHGSRREASNEMLHSAVQSFSAQCVYDIVEPAHMELAQPDIATAFSRCVERGAGRVVVFPYFLSPGRHWTEDIPQLVKEAAATHPGIDWVVTKPFGLHPGMTEIIHHRINEAIG